MNRTLEAFVNGRQPRLGSMPRQAPGSGVRPGTPGVQRPRSGIRRAVSPSAGQARPGSALALAVKAADPDGKSLPSHVVFKQRVDGTPGVETSLQTPRASAAKAVEREDGDTGAEALVLADKSSHDEQWRQLMQDSAFRDGLGHNAAASAAATAVAIAAEGQPQPGNADGQLDMGAAAIPLELPSTSQHIEAVAADLNAATSPPRANAANCAFRNSPDRVLEVQQLEATLAQVSAELAAAVAEKKHVHRQRQASSPGRYSSPSRQSPKRRGNSLHRERGNSLGRSPTHGKKSDAVAVSPAGKGKSAPEDTGRRRRLALRWLPEPPKDAADSKEMDSSATTMPGDLSQEQCTSLTPAAGKMHPPPALGSTSDCDTHLASEDATDASTISMKELSPPAPSPSAVPRLGPLAGAGASRSLAGKAGVAFALDGGAATVQPGARCASALVPPASHSNAEGGLGGLRQAGGGCEPASASPPPPSRTPPVQPAASSLPGLSIPPALPSPAVKSFTEADEWVAGVGGTSGCTATNGCNFCYPGDNNTNILVDMTELAGLVAPLAAANSAHQARVKEAMGNGSFAQAAMQIYQGCDSQLRGCLEWSSGEIQDFVTKVFSRYDLVAPAEERMQKALKYFDVSSSLRLGARSCLCLVDALVRALFHSGMNSQRALASEESIEADGTGAASRGAVAPKRLPALPSPETVQRWLPKDVAHWVVNSLALPPELGEVLLREEVHGPVLLSLTEPDLEKLGVKPFGRRRQLLLGIASLRPEGASQPLTASSSYTAFASPVKVGSSCSLTAPVPSRSRPLSRAEATIPIVQRSLSARAGLRADRQHVVSTAQLSGAMTPPAAPGMVAPIKVPGALLPPASGLVGPACRTWAWPNASTPRGPHMSSLGFAETGAPAAACAGGHAGSVIGAATAAMPVQPVHEKGRASAQVTSAPPKVQSRSASTGRMISC